MKFNDTPHGSLILKFDSSGTSLLQGVAATCLSVGGGGGGCDDLLAMPATPI